VNAAQASAFESPSLGDQDHQPILIFPRLPGIISQVREVLDAKD
jgi:hypothetical protein